MGVANLRKALAERDLPGPYIDRVCLEMESHLRDVTDELTGRGVGLAEAEALAAERLGDPVVLAQGVCAMRERECLWLRYPAASAVVVSVATFLALAAVQLAAVVALIEWIPAQRLEMLQAMAKLLTAGAGAAMVVGFLKPRVSRKWIGLSVAVLLMVSATSVVRVRARGNQPVSATLRLIP